MKLTQIAKALNVSYTGPDNKIKGVSIDSRTLKSGELFIALKGPSFDGHDFVKAAEQAGAAAVIVSAAVETTLPILTVPDTYQALWQLAEWHRSNLKVPFFAMTGSCGKTTTKMVLASILQQAGKTLANAASFNNDIGVPLTILQVTPDYQYAVTEMGANHPGEISKLTQLVKPDVAIITNAASAHLEGFGSVEGVSRAKGEIFQGLPANGVAVLNADDKYVDYWRELVGEKRIVTFGIHNPAGVSARDVRYNDKTQAQFTLCTPAGETEVNLQLLGEHNVYNALAASAAAYARDISLTHIRQGLEAAQPEKKRLVEQAGLNGVTVIDDTYNANPLSVTAAMKILVQRPGISVLVLGDMLELGDNSAQLHRELGEHAAQLGIDRLYCFGKLSQHAAQAFGDNGYYFAQREELIKTLQDDLRGEMTVLVKGSRSMRMELVTQALVGQ